MSGYQGVKLTEYIKGFFTTFSQHKCVSGITQNTIFFSYFNISVKGMD